MPIDDAPLTPEEVADFNREIAKLNREIAKAQALVVQRKGDAPDLGDLQTQITEMRADLAREAERYHANLVAPTAYPPLPASGQWAGTIREAIARLSPLPDLASVRRLRWQIGEALADAEGGVEARVRELLEDKTRTPEYQRAEAKRLREAQAAVVRERVAGLEQAAAAAKAALDARVPADEAPDEVALQRSQQFVLTLIEPRLRQGARMMPGSLGQALVDLAEKGDRAQRYWIRRFGPQFLEARGEAADLAFLNHALPALRRLDVPVASHPALDAADRAVTAIPEALGLVSAALEMVAKKLEGTLMAPAMGHAGAEVRA